MATTGAGGARTWPEARETSAATTGLVVDYVRRHGGEDAVAELLARAEVPFRAAELQDPARWFSYDTRIRLFQAATEVLDDPEATFAIGATSLETNLLPTIVLLIRAIGSPRQVFRRLPRAVAKFSTTSTMQMLEVGIGHARIDYRLHDGYQHSRLDCLYAQGLISTIPAIFHLPPARIVHPQCESDGAEACIYEVSWQVRPRLLRRRATAAALDPELRALRAQLQALRSAASDLVSSDDLGVTLGRIVERAATAVVAPGYLLAVHDLDGGPPLVHSAGLRDEEARADAARLLAGEDLGPNAVVVDVATARRSYGRLAVLYQPQQRSFGDEQALLSAYAAHAAAALELLLALDSSRRNETRSRALLDLAHRLSAAEHVGAVAEAVAAAIPTVVGTPRGSVLGWDPTSGTLRGLATEGLEPAQAAALLEHTLRPDDYPELARMLTRHEPTSLASDVSSEPMRALLAAVGAEEVVAVPLLAGGSLLGVVTTDHGPVAPAGWPDAEAIERLRGLADHAAAALHNARLLTQIRHQADHDALTGLPNRPRFLDSIEERLAASPTTAEPTVAVLFCDLDDFKQVNDRLGHAAGDELLRQVAARLRAVLRQGDLVARLSGDEFALVLAGPDIGTAAHEVADRITDSFSAPFRVDGRELRCTTSIGVAVGGHDDDADHLLRRADAAMYVAKQRGRNQVALADAAPRDVSGIRSTAAELRAGLAAGEFELHYQPIVRLGDAGDTVVGQEALARWRHPELGLLAPAAFLTVAEEGALVAELDLWAVRTAVAAAAGWGGTTATAHVAVNLSAQTLLDRRLPTAVRTALRGADLEPRRLTLEIIESRSLTDLPGVAERLTELRQLGVRIALDDFGTGYSTLTWLQRLPIDQVKLDRSFVAGFGDRDEKGSLVEGVLVLARTLGIEVVAEGVETAAQVERLRAVGCELVQGYRFGRPTPHPSVAT